MRHRLRILIAAGLILSAGCSSTAPEPQAKLDDSDSNSNASSASGLPDELQIASSPVDHSSAENPEKTGKWQPPFPDNVDFFAPPASDSTEQARSADRGRAEVRVIGFSQMSGDVPKALLEIAGRIEMAAIGDSISGLTVVSIEEPSVTLQWQNDRWSVALFDQPPRRPGAAPTTSIARSSSGNINPPRKPGSPLRTQPAIGRIAPEPAVNPSSFAPPQLPVVELPGLNDLPRLPSDLR